MLKWLICSVAMIKLVGIIVEMAWYLECSYCLFYRWVWFVLEMIFVAVMRQHFTLQMLYNLTPSAQVKAVSLLYYLHPLWRQIFRSYFASSPTDHVLHLTSLSSLISYSKFHKEIFLCDIYIYIYFFFWQRLWLIYVASSSNSLFICFRKRYIAI